ncbi:MAG TPA: TadE/TadG family type IV pilus assembly protein [Stellaceae bacterium]|nr:TadE/TadG family type IV pilus assembly protein [Stellaceae bacterium]
MSVLAKLRHGWRRLARGADGAVSVELGVTISLLTALVIPMVDIGMGAYTQMQVQNAAQAGAEYAAVSGWNSANVSTAVTGATGLSSISASPAPAETCGCITSGSITTVTCGSTCASGDTAGTFVTVNAKAQYTTLFNYPGLTSPMNLTAQSTVRIK